MRKKLIIVGLGIVLILIVSLNIVDFSRLKRINKMEFSVLVECTGGSNQSLFVNAFWVYKNLPSLIVNINKTDEMMAFRVKDALSSAIEFEISDCEAEDLILLQNKAMMRTNALLATRYIAVKFVKIEKKTGSPKENGLNLDYQHSQK